MIYCTKCGKENAGTAKFCTGCGGNLTNIAAPKVNHKKNKNQWIIGSLIIVGLLASAYFLFFNKDGENKDISSVSQDMSDTDITKLKDLVQQWNTGLNTANVSFVSSMYAERIVYYRQAMSKGNAAVILSDFFQKNPFYSQQITSAISIEKSGEDLVIAAFDKSVSMNGKTTLYPSYLKFSKENSDWKIVEEGDKITDYNINKTK